jgi:hypothetical protein
MIPRVDQMTLPANRFTPIGPGPSGAAMRQYQNQNRSEAGSVPPSQGWSYYHALTSFLGPASNAARDKGGAWTKVVTAKLNVTKWCRCTQVGAKHRN